MIQKINVGTIFDPQPERCLSISNKLQDNHDKVDQEKVWEAKWNR